MPMNARLLRPRATGFNPRSISGLALWLDPTDSSTLTIDAGVSEWRDKSGNGRHFSSSVGNNQPTLGTINSKTAMQFNGTSHRLFSSGSTIQPNLTGGVTLFLVFEATFPGNGTFLFSQIMDTSLSQRNIFNIALSANQGAAWAFGTLRTRATAVRTGGNTNVDQRFDGVNVSGRNVVTLTAGYTSSSATSTAWRNNTAAPSTSGTSDASGAAGLAIGFRNGATPDLFYVGAIGEVIAYSEELSTSQRLAVQSYLAQRWGVTLA